MWKHKPLEDLSTLLCFVGSMFFNPTNNVVALMTPWLVHVPNGLHWKNPTVEELLHQLRCSLSHYLQGLYIPDGARFLPSIVIIKYRHPKHWPQKWVLPKMVLDGWKNPPQSNWCTFISCLEPKWPLVLVGKGLELEGLGVIRVPGI